MNLGSSALIAIFPNWEKLIETTGFIDFSHYTSKDKTRCHYAGPIVTYDGKKFIDLYIGQGDSVFINLENPADIRFPRDASNFRLPDPTKDSLEQECAVIIFPPNHFWTDFVKYE